MEILIKIIYWISFSIVFYTYAGYGLLMAIWAKFSQRNSTEPSGNIELPFITIVIPAYNEAAVLGSKIRNTLELNYPKSLLQVLVITDGSTDGSPAIVQAFPQVNLLHQPKRLGKATAINKAMESVESGLVILTDANTMVNPEALKLLARHFTDSTVGAVSGEKQVIVNNASGTGEKGEGLYWKYESFLKYNDARVGTLVGAAGELLAFRKNLFSPLEPDTILDDFILSLRICGQGFRVAYEPRAIAIERASPSIRAEQERKIRIAAGGFQAMKRLSFLWQFKKHALLSFQYLSHRVLRWTLAPACLFLLLLTNVYLGIEAAHGWFQFTLLIQSVFYGAACIGWLGARINSKWPVFFIPYYFVFMNWAVVAGFIRFRKGQQPGLWEKAERLSLPVKE